MASTPGPPDLTYNAGGATAPVASSSWRSSSGKSSVSSIPSERQADPGSISRAGSSADKVCRREVRVGTLARLSTPPALAATTTISMSPATGPPPRFRPAGSGGRTPWRSIPAGGRACATRVGGPARAEVGGMTFRPPAVPGTRRLAAHERRSRGGARGGRKRRRRATASIAARYFSTAGGTRSPNGRPSASRPRIFRPSKRPRSTRGGLSTG